MSVKFMHFSKLEEGQVCPSDLLITFDVGKSCLEKPQWWLNEHDANILDCESPKLTKTNKWAVDVCTWGT